MESNYDPDMLKNGPYPPSLKQRISGGEGHLGNVGCAAAAKKLIENGRRYRRLEAEYARLVTEASLASLKKTAGEG